MIRLVQLARDCRGATIIEFALILPMLVLFVYGTFLVGRLMEAHAGMQHALGEGARLTTLCLNPTPAGGCVVASDTQIRNRINAAMFGVGSGTFSVPAPQTGTGFKDLSVTYNMPMDLLLVQGPTVRITRTKRVYTA